MAPPIVDRNLGGANFDRLIYQDFINKHGKDLGDILESQDREAYKTRLEIANQCRDIKHYLSQKIKYQGAIKDYADYILSRQKFEDMISSKIHETYELCQQLIQDTFLNYDELNQVLMIGGSSYIPYLEENLERELSANIKKINRPNLAGCLGAKIYFEAQNTKFQSSKNSKNTGYKDPPKEEPKKTQSSDSSDPFNWFSKKNMYSKAKNNPTQDWF
ncbi:MAG: Hsp70 family protein [Cyanobacteria bacterium P01_A01_bin.80]